MTRIKISEFPISLDLGCGAGKKEGYLGLDRYDFGQEIIWDIDNGLPFPDDSVSRVFSSHFLEHLSNQQLEKLFLELARVCQDGTIIDAWCPHSGTTEAHFLCHYSLWDEPKVKGICQGDIGIAKLELQLTEIKDISIHFVIKVIKKL